MPTKSSRLAGCDKRGKDNETYLNYDSTGRTSKPLYRHLEICWRAGTDLSRWYARNDHSWLSGSRWPFFGGRSQHSDNLAIAAKSRSPGVEVLCDIFRVLDCSVVDEDLSAA